MGPCNSPRASCRRGEQIRALTAAEAEIAAALLRGRSSGEIAAARASSTNTVRTQIKALYAKLDVRSRGELASRFAGLS